MFFHIYFVTIYPYHFNIISMEYQCNIRTRFIRSHCSGKTSVTIDALFLLEHAASHHATGETEKTQSYGWWWIVVLQSSSTVGAVITEIQACDCSIKNWLGPHPTRSSYSSLYLALHFWHQPYITSTGSFAFKHEPVQVTVEFVPLTLSSSVHSHLAEILLQ